MTARAVKGASRRITVYLRPPEAIETLKMIAVLENKSVIDLFNEAVADLLERKEVQYKSTLSTIMKARRKAGLEV